jgi:hypothetical protein
VFGLGRRGRTPVSERSKEVELFIHKCKFVSNGPEEEYDLFSLDAEDVECAKAIECELGDVPFYAWTADMNDRAVDIARSFGRKVGGVPVPSEE